MLDLVATGRIYDTKVFNIVPESNVKVGRSRQLTKVTCDNHAQLVNIMTKLVILDKNRS